jgi:hypothetical protein
MGRAKLQSLMQNRISGQTQNSYFPTTCIFYLGNTSLHSNHETQFRTHISILVLHTDKNRTESYLNPVHSIAHKDRPVVVTISSSNGNSSKSSGTNSIVIL